MASVDRRRGSTLSKLETTRYQCLVNPSFASKSQRAEGWFSQIQKKKTEKMIKV
jgi:hypothetical protein